MAKLISISVNVDKIDKTRLVKGEKGNYLNLTIALNDEQDKFGNDVSCWEGQTKEEREAKAQKNYLGNGKTIWSGGSSTPQQSNDGKDDLPF
jgi:hypothetical protein